MKRKKINKLRSLLPIALIYTLAFMVTFLSVCELNTHSPLWVFTC